MTCSDRTEMSTGIPNSACDACGANAIGFVATIPGFVEGTRYEVFQCPECCSQSVQPMTVPDGLYEAIYRAGEGFAGYARYHRYAKVVEQLHHPLRFLAYTEEPYWSVTRTLRDRGRSRTRRILEVGSGLGYLTAALRKAGYEAWGIDLSDEAVAAARRRFGPWYQPGGSIAEALESLGAQSEFDLIVALELIEHVPDPKALLAQMRTRLAPGGEALISTPNRSAHVPEAVWCSSLPPVHLHWFSELGMRRLGERAGLSSALVDFTDFNRMRVRPRRAGLHPQLPHDPKLSAELAPLKLKPIRGFEPTDRIHDLPFSAQRLFHASRVKWERQRRASAGSLAKGHRLPGLDFDSRTLTLGVRYFIR